MSNLAREFTNLGLSFPEWPWDVELWPETLGRTLDLKGNPARGAEST